MRVCLMANQFPVVTQTWVVQHAAGLLARGHEVVVVPIQARRAEGDLATPAFEDVIARTRQGPAAPRDSGLGRVADSARLLAAGTTLRRAAPMRFAFGRDGFAVQRFAHRLLCATRVARAAPFDVLHAHFGPTGVAAVALRDAGVFDAPVVCSFHGYDANVIAQQWPGCYDGMIGKAERVTAGTEVMRGVVEALGFPSADVAVWPQGVDTNAIAFRAEPRNATNDFHAVSVARLVDFKGIDVSIRAVAAARARVSGLRYTIIGEGERRDDLERLAKELAVDDIVTFAGAQSHDVVLATFADADVFLLTGRVDSEGQKEGQGVAPLEAGASGLPVIAARAGGLTEVVLDGETGILIDPEDYEAAAAAIVRLADDVALRAALGAQGRQHVERSFSHAHSLDVIEEIYRSVGRT
ncbi:MAG: colanic acid/amylovoran biosynthesis glycosyltransferase [Actinomycetota bacterium]